MFRPAQARLNSLSGFSANWRTARQALFVIGLSMSSGIASAASGSAPFCAPEPPTQALPWISSDGASDALEVARSSLLGAYTHGLDPVSFDANVLDRQAHALLARSDRESTDLDTFNLSMTRAVTCYLAQVKLGMLDPRSLHKDIDVPKQDWSASEALAQAWQQNSASDLITSTAPADEQYQQLRIALAQYRVLADQENASLLIHELPSSTLKPGDRDMSVASLRDRLVFLGDMSASELEQAERHDGELISATESTQAAAILAPLYDTVTEQAVRRFQTRHGLTIDGVVGPASLKAMRTPMYLRVAEIEMALERMRWLPDLPTENIVRVNLPEFRLNAGKQAGDLESRVVIGKSVRHPTPIYIGELKHIEFSPYWNVPWSIAKREIVPPMMKDLARMKRRNMEIVTRDGKVHTTANQALLKLVSAGKARIRQRPGSHNALGQVKFVLPNPRGIYMHDTQSVSLFNRDRRDFSHGCVRVEKPAELAQVILQENPEWNSGKIRKALKSSRPVYAKPAKPVMVVFTYQTVSVGADGQTRFLPDVYGYNPRTVKSVERWAGINAENVNATASNSAEGQQLASLSL